jgi:hypothetical protein
MLRRLAVLLALCLMACHPGEPGYQVMSQAEIDQYKALGQMRSGQLMSALVGKLNAAMERGGPVEAIRFCSLQALALTDSVSRVEPAVSVKRVARKVRNPLNAPDPAEARALEVMHSHADLGGELPEELMQKFTRGQRTIVRYYRPIKMGQPCLACHGDPAGFGAELKTALTELYPADQATGYQAGDLRGLIRIEYTLND